MTPSDGLFAEPPRVERPVDTRTDGEKRRDRHLDAITQGWHPLGLALRISLPLHPDAPRDGRREQDGTPRCGGCRFRQRVHGGARSFPKCCADPQPRTRTDPRTGQVYRWSEYPRATHGEGTDVASWWPACSDWQPRPT